MKTTTMKKFMASIAALTLSAAIVAPATSAFAADKVENGKIIIQDAARQNAGKTYEVYKIFDLEQVGSAYKYTVNKQWYTALREAYLAINGVSTVDALPVAYPENNAAAIQALNEEFAKWFEELGKAENVNKLRQLADKLEAAKSGKTPTTVEWTTTTGGVEATLPSGYYLIIDKNTANDSAQSAPILISTNGAADQTIVLKADKPTIEKKIVEGEKRVDANTAGYGDIVTYELTITVPDTSRYDNYTLYVTDQISKGLTLVDENTKGLTDDITVTWVECNDASHTHTNGAKAPDAAPTFTVKEYKPATDTAGESFQIDFNNIKSYGDGEWAGHQIKVQYKAKVNEKAEVGTAGNPNGAKLTYSNNPNTDGTGEPSTSTTDTPEDKVTTYVTEIDIEKVEPDGNTTKPLKGATFKIEKKGSPNTPLYVKVNSDGTATVSADENFAEGSSETFVINTDNATLKLKGLAAGEYVITEVTPPDGYNGIHDSITVTITCKVGDKTVLDEEIIFDGEPKACTWTYEDDIAPGNGNITSEKEGSYKLTVINKTGSLFPSTGGIGTTIFYTVGIAMLAGAGALVVFKRKSDEK